ncbi:MAG: DUF721 domain-containing protein [Deltaproteobacteria bacterium]|nr:DUF721 domain-containing protein [Deltaproteobacteria bacterium]
MKRTGSTHAMNELVDRLLPGLDGGRRGQVLLPRVWSEAVGEVFARESCPSMLVGGVLQVAVSNSNWLHEMRFMKAQILERLHAMLPDTPMSDIRFKVGPVPRPQDPVDTEPLPELSPGEQLHISEQAACIKDEELRGALEAAMTAHARNKKAGA